MPADREEAPVHEPGDDDGTGDQAGEVAGAAEEEELQGVHGRERVGRADLNDPARRGWRRGGRPCTSSVCWAVTVASSVGSHGCSGNRTERRMPSKAPPGERSSVGPGQAAASSQPTSCQSVAFSRTAPAGAIQTAGRLERPNDPSGCRESPTTLPPPHPPTQPRPHRRRQHRPRRSASPAPVHRRSRLPVRGRSRSCP